MKKVLIAIVLTFVWTMNLYAENNSSKDTAPKLAETNSSKKPDRIDKQVQEQMKREEKYAKEQAFYQGSDYNLSEHEVDPGSLDSISVPKPEYDFDMDDVYSD
jgi:hypothetical protein